jgi:glycerol-3-phosphate dehydrogenase
VPWQRALLVGAASGDAAKMNSLPASGEVEYLLEGINAYTGTRKLTKNDVVAAWSSLGATAGESSPSNKEGKEGAKSSSAKGSSKANADRGHQIVEGPNGLLALFGGKLASYRIAAEEVVDTLVARSSERGIELSKSPSRTKRTMIGGWKDKNDYLTVTAIIAAKARKLSLEPATLDHLIESYGKDAQLVVDLVERQPLLNERVCPDFPAIMAEVAYCVLNEMAVSLEDLLFRRMRLAVLHQIQCRQAAPKVASMMQSLLNWDDARAALELQALEKTLDAHMDSFRAVALSSGKDR